MRDAWHIESPVPSEIIPSVVSSAPSIAVSSVAYPSPVVPHTPSVPSPVLPILSADEQVPLISSPVVSELLPMIPPVSPARMVVRPSASLPPRRSERLAAKALSVPLLPSGLPSGFLAAVKHFPAQAARAKAHDVLLVTSPLFKSSPPSLVPSDFLAAVKHFPAQAA